jgi:hypothetical protein
MMTATVKRRCETRSRRLRGRHLLLAWVGLALAVAHPSHGLGIRLCPFRAATGMPCPGCGLTRSLSCTLHGELAAAWDHHPFGPILAALLVAVGVLGLLPGAARTRLTDVLVQRPRLAHGLYTTFVGAFVLFGAARLLAHAWASWVAPALAG